MKERVFYLTVFVLLFTLVPAAPSLAERKGLFRNIVSTFAPPSPQESKTIAKTLELTEEQRKQMKELNEKYRRESSNLKREFNKGYEAVVRLMKATNPDKGRVNEALKRFHEVHSKLLSKEVEYWTSFKSILTPEQNKKFWKLFEKSRVRRK